MTPGEVRSYAATTEPHLGWILTAAYRGAETVTIRTHAKPDSWHAEEDAEDAQ